MDENRVDGNKASIIRVVVEDDLVKVDVFRERPCSRGAASQILLDEFRLTVPPALKLRTKIVDGVRQLLETGC